MLTLASASFAAWWLGLYLSGGPAWGYQDLLLPVIAAGPLATLFFAAAPFSQPYLLFNTDDGTILGPGSWFAWTRARPEREGAAYTARDGWIRETSARGERRRFPAWWADPADWATITTHLAEQEPERRLPPDWTRLGTAYTGAPIRFGINRKLFLVAFLVGLVGTASTCLGLPILFGGPDFLHVVAWVPLAPLAIGLAALVFNPVYTYGSEAGVFVVKSRLTGTSVFPLPGWDLEYSARLGNLYHVRADGKRQIVVPRWTVDPKAWKHFTDLVQERRH
jgi:hypothetical protein